MSNSISANETANRIRDAYAAARYGTTHTAYFLQPRNYYYALSSTDDFMALELLVIDQARLWCENAVTAVSRDRSVWRGRFKQIASQLYRPRTYPLPVCNEVSQAMLRNMTEDEVLSFGVMASHIDDLIKDDMQKLAITLFNEVGRNGVRQQDAMTHILSCHLLVLIAEKILERCEEVQCGSHYWLCLEPTEASSRERAYYLSSRDLSRMSTLTSRLLNELCRGQHFTIPYTVPMETSVNIICTRICDVVNIYNACMEAGINISEHSYKDLERIVERISREREQQQKRQDIRDSQSIDIRGMGARFAAKGWNVKGAMA